MSCCTETITKMTKTKMNENQLLQLSEFIAKKNLTLLKIILYSAVFKIAPQSSHSKPTRNPAGPRHCSPPRNAFTSIQSGLWLLALQMSGFLVLKPFADYLFFFFLLNNCPAYLILFVTPRVAGLWIQTHLTANAVWRTAARMGKGNLNMGNTKLLCFVLPITFCSPRCFL